jgi:hypothetical protein
MKVTRFVVLLAAVIAAPTAAGGQSGFELTIENIMRGPEHVGQSPSFVRWSEDGRWIYFRWLPGGDSWDAQPSTYRVASRGGEPEKLTDEQEDSLSVVLSSGGLVGRRSAPDRSPLDGRAASDADAGRRVVAHFP